MGQMWVEKQQADDSFTMIPTYSYRYLYIFVWIELLIWDLGICWTLLEYHFFVWWVGLTWMALLSKQASSCGSVGLTLSNILNYLYIYSILYIHNYIHRRFKVRTWTSHNFHWWIVMSVPIIIFAACILKFACHISQLWVGDPSLRAATGADSHVFREACGFTATPPGRCGVDVGAHGFCWEFGQQEPARKWTRIHNRKLTHGRVWKCGITWYNMV